jgi:uncharacterized protein YgbK (DUF1537 family)
VSLRERGPAGRSRNGEWSLAVLDDDPTGVQTLGGLRVLLSWDPARLQVLLERVTAVHLLTNSRALAPAEARELVGTATAAVKEARADAAVVLRGDSTLRGHILEEYLGVCDGGGFARYPVLLLAPALPSAGRVTLGGVQYLERDGARVPVHLTEFAHDGVFSYKSSRLLEWVEERSQGFFPASRGTEVGLDAIREQGADAVVKAIVDGRRDGPAAIAVDAETSGDVEAIAAGFKSAQREGADVVLRCGPAVAGALGDATASGLVEMPFAEEVLVVCGSYVSQSRRQLDALELRHPGATVEVDAHDLASANGGAAARAASAVGERLQSDGLAILATPADRPDGLVDLASGLQIARGLAEIVRKVDRPQAVTVVKGGVTSAITMRIGFGAVEADVIGPVLLGVAFWQAFDEHGRSRDVLVVPGNVGDDELLIRISELLRSGARG